MESGESVRLAKTAWDLTQKFGCGGCGPLRLKGIEGNAGDAAGGIGGSSQPTHSRDVALGVVILGFWIAGLKGFDASLTSTTPQVAKEVGVAPSHNHGASEEVTQAGGEQVFEQDVPERHVPHLDRHPKKVEVCWSVLKSQHDKGGNGKVNRHNLPKHILSLPSQQHCHADHPVAADTLRKGDIKPFTGLPLSDCKEALLGVLVQQLAPKDEAGKEE